MDYIVWHITESEEELRQGLQHPEYFADKVASLKSGSKRLLEVLAVRLALKHLFYGVEVPVAYDQHGAPHLEPVPQLPHPPYVSISHTTDFAAVITSDKPVGIDIERRGRRVARVVSRFLKAEEVALLTLLSAGDDEVFTLLLHLAWSAKEAAYKVLGPDYYDLQQKTTLTFLSLSLCQISLAVEGRSEPMLLRFNYNDYYVLVYTE